MKSRRGNEREHRQDCYLSITLCAALGRESWDPAPSTNYTSLRDNLLLW